MWTFPHYRIGAPLDWAALDAHYPWLADMHGVPQDSEWHGEGDVHTHTRMVVDALLAQAEYQALDAQSQHILLAAALLHDVEKRSTTTTEQIDGTTRIVSPRHAKKGEYTARRILYQDIPAPFAIREAIAKLVRLHGLPLWALDKSDPVHAVIAASQEVNTRHLALLARADVLGRISPDRVALLLAIDLFAEQCRDSDCWGTPRAFASAAARHHYLSHPGAHPDYIPYEDHACTVTMLCGLPGSGKDTYIARHLADQPMLSLDDIRRRLGINPTDKKRRGAVIQQGREEARAHLRRHENFVFNATNLTRELRGKWIALFTDYRARIRIIYLEVPYRQWLRQNRERTHSVPESVLYDMLGKLEMPGYDEAHEVQHHISDTAPCASHPL